MSINVSEEQSVEILTKIFTDAGIDFRKKEPNEEGGFFYKENGVLKKFTGNIFVKRLLEYDTDLSSSIVRINDLCGENEELEIDVNSECEWAVSKDTPQKAVFKTLAVEYKPLTPIDKSWVVFDCAMPTDDPEPTDLDAA